MPADPFPAPTRRADAERNRDKILTAARAAFADPDAEVSMAEISRRARVGMATLYRNFPGRQELLEALYTDEVNAVCEAAETIEGETPGSGSRGLAAPVLRLLPQQTPHRLRTAQANGPQRPPVRQQPHPGARRRSAAARRRPDAHEIRDDLTLEQILDMIVAIATIHGDTDYTEPILQTALDGLRPRPARHPHRAARQAG